MSPIGSERIRDGMADPTGSGDECGRKLLESLQQLARGGLARLTREGKTEGLFEHARLRGSGCELVRHLARRLLESSPIVVERGFEGNNGIEGGVWRLGEGSDDAVVYLRFSAGTCDLPLHVHEHSDRYIIVDQGVGLFHYAPMDDQPRELRSVIVQEGDVMAFTRGLLHTFTAPIEDLTLLSFHAPFFEFDDARQFAIPESVSAGWCVWTPSTIRRRNVNASGWARPCDVENEVR